MGKELFSVMVGEFGWELFCWQGILRKMSKDFRKVYVAGRRGHDILYKDFAEYIPFDTIGNVTSGMRNKDYTYPDLHKNYDADTVILPETYLTHYNPDSDNKWFHDTEQEFISYGKNIDINVDILIHARHTDKWGSGYRNWDIEKWNKLTRELIKQGYRIGSIGKSDQIYNPPWCAILDDLKLEKLVDIMHSAKLIIGPSSGPMHLAALTNLPRVTWGKATSEKIYKHDWNPFDVYVDYIIDDGWSPSVEQVLESVNKSFKNKHYDTSTNK